MTVLTTEDLVIDIPGRADGRPLTLRVAPGQRWGVLGPNGVGKTTLLHTLAGLRAPRAGRVLLDDTPVEALKRKRVAQQLALVFQDRQDGFPATVLETALIGRHPFLAPWRREGAEDLLLAREALTALAVDHLADRLVTTLSGGERQRVAIATALAQTPSVWLADEPTNHLDLHHQVAVMKLLHERAERGAAVVMGLHDLNLAARWCDHLLLLYPDGQHCFGPAEAMLEPTALAHLYGQPLTMARVGGAPVFVPADPEPGVHDDRP
ncbi:ABC transporter ATP-binding protein [Alloalcanivorax sp. C16-1]|uniref:ABC transporter ATP-binding protein n=1 Tax=Alloalcanivorax sp. C16-1 TaxID=3390051 RepID=UPI0039705875